MTDVLSIIHMSVFKFCVIKVRPLLNDIITSPGPPSNAPVSSGAWQPREGVLVVQLVTVFTVLSILTAGTPWH